jgi:hypothetical protein
MIESKDLNDTTNKGRKKTRSSAQANEGSIETNPSDLFSSESVLKYFLAFFALIVLMGFFYMLGVIFNVPLAGIRGLNQMNVNLPLGNQGGGQISSGFQWARLHPRASRFPIINNITIWPIWGTFSLPTLIQLLIFSVTGITFVITAYYIYKYQKYRKLWIITLAGIVLIILSNLINGWEQGIAISIGETGGLYSDALSIDNLFQFISDYNSIYSTLGVHTRTHPPGAVSAIYLLYVIFKDSGIIAIAVCILSTVFSVYFLNGIFNHFFRKELSNYISFLYLLLPAVQIYYLANIYAIITTLVLGVFYFYLHSNTKISIGGSIFCGFLATFTSFMAAFIILCLFIFELLRSHRKAKIQKGLTRKERFIVYMENLTKLCIISISILLIYTAIFLITGFNYLETFLLASASESQGFAFASLLSYIITRASNILDILIFFGPILIILLYYGLKVLKRKKAEDSVSSTIYLYSISAFISLVLIFLTGAYDHGETARGAMFIYIFLLLPVAAYLQEKTISKREKYLLLAMVFIQTISMQLFGMFVW